MMRETLLRSLCDEDEFWCEHPIYTGYYGTNKGRIFSGKTNDWLSRSVSVRGYYKVKIWHRVSKTIQVAVFIGEIFVENPDNKPTINHINRIRTDNRIENLEWATRSEQTK